MNKIPLFAIPVVLMFASSCTTDSDRRTQAADEIPGIIEIRRPFTITDFKDKAEGGSMPEWVNRWLEGGVSAVEALDVHEGRRVFIGRNEGNNFNALRQWAEWFLPDLDFPRLAAARIEARFLSGVSRPDTEYGAFFVSLIRAASDTLWVGAIKEDYFWIRREFYPVEDAFPETGEASSLVEEDWEFLILVTIDEALFASQLDTVFRNVHPSPQPTRDQLAAANRVKDQFFDGF